MAAPVKAAYDLDHFNLKDMTECGVALRKIGTSATSAEDVCQGTVGYLYDTLVSGQLGANACALARFFITAPYGQLAADLQKHAQYYKKDVADSTQCLILMGTRGIKMEWNDRLKSKRHQAVPLDASHIAQDFPMIAELLSQLGVPVEKVAASGSKFLVSEKKRNFNVFYVPDATNAAAIPGQKDFVQPHNVKSVVGYGGLLPSGQLFTVILFLRASISHQTALAFRPFALHTKIALLPFDEPDLLFSRI